MLEWRGPVALEPLAPPADPRTVGGMTTLENDDTSADHLLRLTAIRTKYEEGQADLDDIGFLLNLVATLLSEGEEVIAQSQAAMELAQQQAHAIGALVNDMRDRGDRQNVVRVSTALRLAGLIGDGEAGLEEGMLERPEMLVVNDGLNRRTRRQLERDLRRG